MIALSLRQPWAWLMIRPDLQTDEEREAAAAAGLIKDIENRKWRTFRRGEVHVHAALTMTPAYYRNAADFAAQLGVTVPPAEQLQRGGIIGKFDIVDCVTEHASPWFFGPKGFVVANARPVPFQPCPGRLNFFVPAL